VKKFGDRVRPCRGNAHANHGCVAHDSISTVPISGLQPNEQATEPMVRPTADVARHLRDQPVLHHGREHLTVRSADAPMTAARTKRLPQVIPRSADGTEGRTELRQRFRRNQQSERRKSKTYDL
jgi:hypothetical protein